MTRRQLLATCIGAPLARLLPECPSAAPSPLVEHINFAYVFTKDGMYAVLGNEIRQMDYSLYWHGQPPFVLLDLKAVPWR